MAYITRTELAAWLDMKDMTANEQAERLDLAIAAADLVIDRQTNRTFSAVGTAETWRHFEPAGRVLPVRDARDDHGDNRQRSDGSGDRLRGGTADRLADHCGGPNRRGTVAGTRRHHGNMGVGGGSRPGEAGRHFVGDPILQTAAAPARAAR